MIEFRSHYFFKQLSRLHLVADVDFALGDIAAGPRKDVCVRESRCRGGQTDNVDLGARLDGFDTHLRHHIPARLRDRIHFAALRIMFPAAPGEYRHHQKDEAHPPQQGSMACSDAMRRLIGLPGDLDALEVSRSIDVHSGTSSNTP